MTCNGPGEFAGWVRPLALAFAHVAPQVELHVFFLPDDYATGRESEVARAALPGLHVHSPSTYFRVALCGRGRLPPFDGVLYLGGDVMHAVVLRRRLGARLFAYRYVPRWIAAGVDHAFALDEQNRRRIERVVPSERVTVTGNLAVDGALAEASREPETTAPLDGVLFMPGSRRREIAHLLPFFATVAVHLRRLRPDLPIAFGLSPFTKNEAIATALRPPLEPQLYAKPGSLVALGEGAGIVVEGEQEPFPLLHRSLAAARRAALVVTIPGTKCIELAALGVPTLVCTPFNLPERAAINGPLTYLDRLPVIGRPLKRAAVLAFAQRFRYFAQPNIDADREVMPELVGTLTPMRVAERAVTLIEDEAGRVQQAEQLRLLSAPHVGAVARMTQGLLDALSRERRR